MILKQTNILLILFFGFVSIQAQSDAGKNAFAVLNFYNSAQMTARGINFMPRFTNDIASAITNPAILCDSLNNNISLTYTDLFAGAFQGAIAYGHKFDKLGNFGFGLQYLNYGTFTKTEANGDITGKFYANEFVFSIGWGTQIEKNLYIGATFKPIIAQYDVYTSFALAFDLSATYNNPNKSWQTGIILKNVGRQIVSFNDIRDTLDLNLQAGFAKKFAHAPVILYIIADNLTKWNIREDDKLNPRYSVGIDGKVNSENNFSAFLDKGFRHLHFAIDIISSEKFYLSLGYSWRQHQEMKVDDAFSLAGLSYGLTIKWKQFTLSYARNEYHNYGSPNYLTLGYTFNK